MSLTDAEVAAYLSRLELGLPKRVSEESLIRLQQSHLLCVPFENLDIHRGRPIVLELPALFEKVVTRGRGGFCYELNGLFAQLLSALGYRVTLLAAEVARGDGTFGPPFDHLLLRVDLARSYIVDVGFGDGFSEPLMLVADFEQPQGQKTFTLRCREGYWELHSRLGLAGWKTEYRFTLDARELSSFAAMCRYQQTSPESYFTQARICTIQTRDGRLTLSGNRFIETIDGLRSEGAIRDEGELNSLLIDRFGISYAGNDALVERSSGMNGTSRR